MKKLILSILLFITCLIGYTQSIPNVSFPTTEPTADAYAVNVTNYGTSYNNKITFVEFRTPNSGPATINITPSGSTALGAKQMRIFDGSDWIPLSSGDINGDTTTWVLHYHNASGTMHIWKHGSGTGGGGGPDTNTSFNALFDRTKGGDFTLALADTSSMIYLENGGGPIEITIPDFSAVSLNKVLQFAFFRDMNDTVTFDVGGETVILSAANLGISNRNYLYLNYRPGNNQWYASSESTGTGGGGSGDVTKVGTPANNQVGVWTGDGTIEGASSLTYDGSNLQLTGDIGSTGTRITKGWFTDLQVTNAIAGSITGNAATVTTNANLTGHVTSTGNAAVLGSFSSSNLLTALTDETGTGAAVFGTTPTIATPSFTTGFTIGGAATSRKMIVGNGTNFVASTETWAVPGTSGNILQSDGTNWVQGTTSAGAAVTASNGPFTVSLGGSSVTGAVNTFSIGVTPTGVSSVADGDILVGDGTNTFVALNVLNTTRTANWHLKAGTTTALTAPLKQTSGSLLTSPESGAVEMAIGHYMTSNNLNRVAVGGPIVDFIADVGNSGTSETDIYSYTTKASTLAANSEKIIFTYTLTLADITATAQIKVVFAGTTIADTGALTVSATGAIVVTGWVIRSGASTARASVTISSPTASTAVYTSETDLTGLTFTNTNILKMTATAGGAGGGTNDIVGKMGVVSWFPAASN